MAVAAVIAFAALAETMELVALVAVVAWFASSAFGTVSPLALIFAAVTAPFLIFLAAGGRRFDPGWLHYRSAW